MLMIRKSGLAEAFFFFKLKMLSRQAFSLWRSLRPENQPPLVIIKLPNVYTILKQRLTFKNSLKKQLELICSLLLEVLLDFTFLKVESFSNIAFRKRKGGFYSLTVALSFFLLTRFCQVSKLPVG